MDIVGTKITVAVLFGIIRFTFGTLSIQVCSWLGIESTDHGKRIVTESKRRTLDYVIAKLQSFGGGVLFATCLLHMMPEVYHSVEELRHLGIITHNYPYSQLIVSLGFFLIYFLEEFSHWIISNTPEKPCEETKKARTLSELVEALDQDKDAVNHQNGNLTQVKPNKNSHEEVVRTINEKVQTDDFLNIQNDQTDFDELNNELDNIIEQEVKTKQQIIRCIFAVTALSFHAIFEGLAIGLQNSIANIWYLFTAVSVHSATILFCLGLEVFLAGAKVKTVIFHMLFLASTSPIGVILGLVASLTADTHNTVKSFVVVFLEGLSAGTILYIVFFEILIREKQRRVCRVMRAFYIGLGFVLMAGLECIKMIN